MRIFFLTLMLILVLYLFIQLMAYLTDEKTRENINGKVEIFYNQLTNKKKKTNI